MSEPTEPVTLGEVARNLDRLTGSVDRLTEQIARHPTWRDLDRAAEGLRAEYRPLEERIKDLETADGDRQREARGMRGQTLTAITGAGLSLVVTLLAVVLTGS